MIDESQKMIAVCGLDCAGCDMRMATSDKELAADISGWFKRKLGKDIRPEEIHCDWCRGDREIHWSADCWILQCCVDEKGHDYCCECDDFPCERLEEWATKDERYREALERLKTMKEDRIH